MTKLSEDELHWSDVVANNAMNRERNAFGINSYEKEIGINPLEFIKERKAQESICWFDLCCGQGNAIIQVAEALKEDEQLTSKLSLVGIDLVDYFSSFDESLNIQLKEQNLKEWTPKQEADLVTIVHGLHYVGDKIDLIIKAIEGLKPNGILVGNLDLDNIIIEHVKESRKIVLKHFDELGVFYDKRRRILFKKGRASQKKIFKFIGADDKAGPNYTGQNVVNSYYELEN